MLLQPGASEAAAQLTRQALRLAARARLQTMDQYIDLLGLPSGGALRASLGLASVIGDVERFLAFVETTYQDRLASTGGLAPPAGLLAAGARGGDRWRPGNQVAVASP
jgi:hypothetical protein